MATVEQDQPPPLKRSDSLVNLLRKRQKILDAINARPDPFSEGGNDSENYMEVGILYAKLDKINGLIKITEIMDRLEDRRLAALARMSRWDRVRKSIGDMLVFFKCV